MSLEHDRHDTPDAEPDARLQRAYGALLGNDYERHLMEHVQLSSVAKLVAPDLERAMTWAVGGVEEAAATMPPLSYAPLLITDEGAAMFGIDSFYRLEPGVGLRINDFVKALEPSYAVVVYASGDKKLELFSVVGTDGFTLRDVKLAVSRKRFGGTTVELVNDEELVPWEGDHFLSPVSRTLRELKATSSEQA